MANTAFATENALTKKLWSAKLTKEIQQSLALSNMMDESGNKAVHVKTDLMKQKGDRITIGLRMRPSGAGQTSSTTGITLEGNEEALSFYDFSVSLSEYGNAFRTGSKLDLQRPAFDLRTELKDAAKEWASDRLEDLLAAALVASPTSNRYYDKTATGSDGYLTVAYIQMLKRQAKLANPKVPPMKIGGKDYWVLLAHPYALKGLKADTEYKNMQLYANIRGNKNPLISGAEGLVDGVLIYEYDRDALLQTGDVVRSVLLGRQALLLAWGQKPSWYEKLFDYERIPGVATDFVLGVGKTVFNSEDFGCMTIDNDYAADS